MGKVGYIMIGLTIIVIAIVVGVYLYQKQKTQDAVLEAQKIQLLTGSLNQTNSQQGGLGAFFNNFLGQTFGFASSTLQTQGGQAAIGSLIKLI